MDSVLAKMIHARGADDRAQPAFEAAGILQMLQMSIDLEKRLLRHVARDVRVSQDVEGDGRDQVGVFPDQGLEGLEVALPPTVDQRAVVHFGVEIFDAAARASFHRLHPTLLRRREEGPETLRKIVRKNSPPLLEVR